MGGRACVLKNVKVLISCDNFNMVGPRVFKHAMVVGQDQQMTTGHFKVIQLEVKVTVTLNVKMLKFLFFTYGWT